MADIFISYAKEDRRLTEELARDLQAEGYTTWWDTRLLPDDELFWKRIQAEIEAAKAVIVIWSEHSIGSRWVYSEAQQARGKLLQVRDAALDPLQVPMPFSADNISLLSDRRRILSALERKRVAPTRTKPFMRTTMEFLREIEVFLQEFDMAPTPFGQD